MSILNWFKTPISIVNKEILPALYVRSISIGNPALCEAENASEVEDGDKITKKGKPIHPVETCLEYMNSEAYEKTYGDKPVWHTYVRNFKGGRPPRTRKNCWSWGRLNRGSPCPICRDEYLLPHYLNVKLLKQFICPHGGQVLDSLKTGVCQRQQLYLEVAIQKARNYGLITYTVPHRVYDYNLYNKK